LSQFNQPHVSFCKLYVGWQKLRKSVSKETKSLETEHCFNWMKSLKTYRDLSTNNYVISVANGKKKKANLLKLITGYRCVFPYKEHQKIITFLIIWMVLPVRTG
jgi:hypothetical protein